MFILLKISLHVSTPTSRWDCVMVVGSSDVGGIVGALDSVELVHGDLTQLV